MTADEQLRLQSIKKCLMETNSQKNISKTDIFQETFEQVYYVVGELSLSKNSRGKRLIALET